MGFTFITANDIHISDVNPRSRKDDFKLAILNKLEQMGQACRKLGADAAIIAGDLFNHKSPARNSHRLNQDLIRTFKAFECPIYMIPGNHDLTANDLGSLSSQPLGVLFEDGTLIDLRHAVIEKEGKKVSLVGVPYTEDLDLETVEMPHVEACVAKICVLHLCAGPKGGQLFKERLYGYDELATIGADVYVIGHYHLDQGITRLGKQFFINVGSLSRGTLSDETIDHHPQIGLITVDDEDSVEVRSIKLRVKPAAEVFDLNRREEEKQESKVIEQFVEKLLSEDVSGDKDTDIMTLVEGMDMAKEVRDRALAFIQAAVR